MTRLAPIAIAAAMTAMIAAPRAQAPQAPAPSPLELAAQGKVAEAWKSWEALPPGAERLRTGVQIAAVTRQIDRGITLYTELANTTKTPDLKSLGVLAVGAAHDIADGTDRDARLTACSAALLINRTDAICRKLLDTLAASRNPAEQATGVYALANAGIRSDPGAISALAGSMESFQRLEFVQSFTHLSNAERVALLQPLVTSTDVATQYQAALLLAGLPGDAAIGPLRQLANVNGPPKNAATIGLALHGDAAAVRAVGDMLPSLTGYERILAGRALAVSLDPRGVDVLEALTRSTADIDRINTAEALARINPDMAFRTLRDSLNAGSAAVRDSALHAAGVVRMGTDPIVYTRLAGNAPSTRAWAVFAIAETISPPPPSR